jgi:hypothetical protein
LISRHEQTSVLGLDLVLEYFAGEIALPNAALSPFRNDSLALFEREDGSGTASSLL